MADDKKIINTTQADAGDIFAQDSPEKRLDQIKSLVQSTYHNLDKISRIVEKIQQDERKEMYKNMPGIEGEFDGFYLIAEDGSKHEVPANYAAKSRLVYGDKLKIVEEDGKKVFKQIQKLERKEIKGVLSKKEGKWYLLSDSGTYKISDTAAEFYKVELKEEAVALVPADHTNVPFAALDQVIRKEVPAEAVEVKPGSKSEVKSEKPEESKQKKEPAPKKPMLTVVKEAFSKPAVKKPPFIRPVETKRVIKKTDVNVKRTEKTAEPAQKEYVAGLLEDDDLR
jgi:uncharacterized pyridoxamine 5'-phosphate oxidase family protein